MEKNELQHDIAGTLSIHRLRVRMTLAVLNILRI
jgi:hypothetical protein